MMMLFFISTVIYTCHFRHIDINMLIAVNYNLNKYEFQVL